RKVLPEQEPLRPGIRRSMRLSNGLSLSVIMRTRLILVKQGALGACQEGSGHDQRHRKAPTSSGRGDRSGRLPLPLAAVIIEPFGRPTARWRLRIMPDRRARPMLRSALVLSLAPLVVIQSATPA